MKTAIELSELASDVGVVSGVLQGIELTPTLLPNQKDAIANARKAIERIKQNIQQDAIQSNPDTVRLDWLEKGKNANRLYANPKGFSFVDDYGATESNKSLRTAIDNAREKEKK